MGEITIEPGDTKKIVSQPGTDEEYNITVENADVYMAHDKSRAVSSGKRVRPGDRVTVSNLRGRSLYAKNPPGNDENARLEVNEAGFALFFQPRPVVGAVRTSAGAEASPANDEDAWSYGTDVDVSGGVTTGLIDLPDATEALVVNVDEADDTFEVAVVFTDDEGTEITRRDSGNKSGFAGNSTTDVFASVEPAAPYAEVELSGAATSLDYTVYAR